MRITRKTLWITGILFLIVAAAALILQGSSYTFRADTGEAAPDPDRYQVSIEQDHEVIRVTDQHLDGGVLTLKVRSVSRGKAYIDVKGPAGSLQMWSVYVHPFGIITEGSFFGRSAGAGIIPVLVTIYAALLLWYVVIQYRAGKKRNLYQYRNIRNLGWIIFLILMLAGLVPYIFDGESLVGSVDNTLHSASNVAFIAFPVAFVVSILVSISNIQLMRKEGRNWQNMLGFLLGLLVCVGTVFPSLLSEYLQRTTLVDVHNEQGMALYVEMAVENSILVAVSYLECILAGTIILARQAAKRIPAFDKDYILILGCQIRKDGTLTPLLRGRADRALEFARMQKEKTGKDIVFVPSGGKGSDEVMAEAQAVRNYLAEAGIPDGQILVEDGSADTYENFRNSAALIRERGGEADPKIAFSTTNYHVFRSGILAAQQGIRAEGIGSGTRSYFWINAFVREFIATVAAEWKRHLKIIALLMAAVVAMVLMVRASNVL